MHRPLAAMLTAIAIGGCVPSFITDPGDPDAFAPPGTEFRASIDRAQFSLGDTATITFVLRNNRKDTLRLSFGMGCPTLPYVTNLVKDVVYPSGGSWGCTAVISSIALGPGEQRVDRLVVRGMIPPAPATYTGVLLPPGEYLAYAVLTGDQGRTNAVRFRVTP